MRFNQSILAKLQGLGYTTVGWTAAAKDFETITHRIAGLRPEDIGDRILAHVDNGAIILLHDTKQTAEALPNLITSLKARGFTFVTVPQMLDHLARPVIVRSNAGRFTHA